MQQKVQVVTLNSLPKSSLPTFNSKSNDVGVLDPFRERQECSSDGQQEQGKESQESSTNDTDVVVAAMPV